MLFMRSLGVSDNHDGNLNCQCDSQQTTRNDWLCWVLLPVLGGPWLGRCAGPLQDRAAWQSGRTSI
jgi:hypothetical protein